LIRASKSWEKEEEDKKDRDQFTESDNKEELQVIIFQYTVV
jgi:hypothetical protein